MRCLVENSSERIAHKGPAPELHRAVLLFTHTVDAYDVDAVGYSVTPLYGLPRVELFAVNVIVLSCSPTDRCRIEQNFRSHQCGDPRPFRGPLIPADQPADVGMLCLEYLVSEVAECEVEFLIIRRVVRDVPFPVFPKIGTVRIDDRGRIVIYALRALLE